MAGNGEQVRALVYKSSTQVRNGKDATETRAELVKECRASGSPVLAELADRLEGKR